MRNKLINELLVDVFHSALETQQKIIHLEGYEDLSDNDMFILRAIGLEDPKNMSTVARYVNMTQGAFSEHVKHLEKKGYLQKTRNNLDKRNTWITLTPSGKKAVRYYKSIMRESIFAMMEEMSDEEVEALIHGLTRMDEYLKASNRILDEKIKK